MKPLYIAICIALINATSGAALASSSPFTCSELAIFARGLTVTRDNGTSLARVRQIIEDESQFTASDKESFKKIAATIYQSPSIGPDAMAAIARRECIKTGKRRP